MSLPVNAADMAPTANVTDSEWLQRLLTELREETPMTAFRLLVHRDYDRVLKEGPDCFKCTRKVDAGALRRACDPRVIDEFAISGMCADCQRNFFD